LAHDPQHSMLRVIKERATAYVSGWYKTRLLRRSPIHLRTILASRPEGQL
jgi:hypothetical protein